MSLTPLTNSENSRTQNRLYPPQMAPWPNSVCTPGFASGAHRVSHLRVIYGDNHARGRCLNGASTKVNNGLSEQCRFLRFQSRCSGANCQQRVMHRLSIKDYSWRDGRRCLRGLALPLRRAGAWRIKICETINRIIRAKWINLRAVINQSSRQSQLCAWLWHSTHPPVIYLFVSATANVPFVCATAPSQRRVAKCFSPVKSPRQFTLLLSFVLTIVSFVVLT